jgi:uncharacterized RDD family membrane protein YckC
MTLMLATDPVDVEAQRTLAGRGARFAAMLFDTILLLVAQLIPSPAVGRLWILLVGAINLWGILTHGQTIGKCLLKIAIVEQESNLPPGYMRAAVIRSGPQAVLSMLSPVAAAVYLVVDSLLIFSASRQCLHDRLARTVVVEGTREWWSGSHA